MAKAADPTAMPAMAPVPKPPSPSLAEELDTALVAESEASLAVVLEVVSAIELEAAPSGSKNDFRRPSLFVKTAATSWSVGQPSPQAFVSQQPTNGGSGPMQLHQIFACRLSSQLCGFKSSYLSGLKLSDRKFSLGQMPLPPLQGSDVQHPMNSLVAPSHIYNLEEGSGQLRPKKSTVLLCKVAIWDLKQMRSQEVWMLALGINMPQMSESASTS